MADKIQWAGNTMPKSDDKHLGIMSLDHVKKARAFHQSFPQYTVTPLARLDGQAARLGLSNLCVVLDRNHLQIDGTTETVMNSAPLEEKLKAFNFNVVTIDGHDYDQIEAAMQAFHAETAKPTCIIMDTTKGKGVSYMTNSVDWHGKGPNDDEYKIAIEELNAAYAALEQEEN